MKLLEEIIASKKVEVQERRQSKGIDELIRMPLFEKVNVSLSSSIVDGSGVISEFKRKSPSAGNIHNLGLNQVIDIYNNHPISGFSVLTDTPYFGGSVDDLLCVQQKVNVPVLRKEFIIDEYQLFEAKAYGADAILLIAEALDQYHSTHLTTIAHSIGLEVLMEFHSEDQLEKLNEAVDVIGVNNRNLSTLKTELSTSEKLIKHLPYQAVKITESGITSPFELDYLYGLGFHGCLIGESVLKNDGLLAKLCDAAHNAKSIKHES